MTVKDGGADRNRTCDLLIANETLYQLSYDPIHGADVDTLGIDESSRNPEVGRNNESGSALSDLFRVTGETVNILVIIVLLS